jgi:hypothetical protein
MHGLLGLGLIVVIVRRRSSIGLRLDTVFTVATMKQQRKPRHQLIAL